MPAAFSACPASLIPAYMLSIPDACLWAASTIPYLQPSSCWKKEHITFYLLLPHAMVARGRRGSSASTTALLARRGAGRSHGGRTTSFSSRPTVAMPFRLSLPPDLGGGGAAGWGGLYLDHQRVWGGTTPTGTYDSRGRLPTTNHTALTLLDTFHLHTALPVAARRIPALYSCLTYLSAAYLSGGGRAPVPWWPGKTGGTPPYTTSRQHYHPSPRSPYLRAFLATTASPAPCLTTSSTGRMT